LEKAMSELTFRARLEGVDEVTGGFERMGNAAGNMGNKVASSSRQMETNYRSLMVTTAGLISNSIQLGDIMDRMAKGQLDVGKGAAMLTLNFLQLASQVYMLGKAHWAAVVAGAAHIGSMIAQKVASAALTLVEYARAVAHFIANAVASMGTAVPVMLAAAAASIALGAYFAKPMAEGGIIREPTFALIGERGPEAVIPLPQLRGNTTIHITINEARTPRETGDAVVDALRRSGMI
jgi:hypothetical protein